MREIWFPVLVLMAWIVAVVGTVFGVGWGLVLAADALIARWTRDGGEDGVQGMPEEKSEIGKA